MRRITATFAKSIKAPGFYRADPSLYLFVKETGAKSWVQRIVVNGRRRNIGLGPFPLVSIEEARDAAFENRRMVFRGHSPITERQRATVPTFQEAALKFQGKQRTAWQANRIVIFSQVMDKHVYPIFGNVPVDRITQQDVLSILSRVWKKTPYSATRLRGFIRQVFSYCQAHEYVKDNPAGDAIDAALPSLKKIRKNYRSLPYQETPEALQTIEGEVKGLATKLCLLFTIYNGARGGESRAATWSEIDLKNKVWTIPADKMKAGKAHRVPLSSAALEVLKRAETLKKGNNGLVFPSAHKKGVSVPMTAESLTRTLKQIGLGDKTTPHGFRSSFKTWANETTDYPNEVIETALAHTVGNGVEQAYMRGDLFDKRRGLMQSWADYLTA